MPEFDPRIFGYSKEARQWLARGPFLGSPHVPNRYAEFAVSNSWYFRGEERGANMDFWDFNAGNFILDLDAFLSKSRASWFEHSSLVWGGPFYTALGNNFPDGVSSPTDAKFKKHWPMLVQHKSIKMNPNSQESSVRYLLAQLSAWPGSIAEKAQRLQIDPAKFNSAYGAELLEKSCPFFAILGPKDYRLNERLFFGDSRKQAMHQVCHSYVEKDAYDNFNMPAPYYVLFSLRFRTVFLCIDSTTFLFDKVQQQWLLDVYHEFSVRYPGNKFTLLSYHPLRYNTCVPQVTSAKSPPPASDCHATRHMSYRKEAAEAPEWHLYQQNALGLTQFPSIIVNRKGASAESPPEYQWDCNPQGARLGLNNTIGSGLELFLSANNIAISEIYSSLFKAEQVDTFSITLANGTEQKITQYYCSQESDPSYVSRYQPNGLLGTRDFNTPQPLPLSEFPKGRLLTFEETSPCANRLMEWVILRTKENLLQSKTFDNPPLDLSLLRNPDLWMLMLEGLRTPSAEAPYVSTEYQDRTKAYRQSGLFEELHETYSRRSLGRADNYLLPAQFYKTIAMLLDARYNPLLLLFAFLKNELLKNNLHLRKISPHVANYDSENFREYPRHSHPYHASFKKCRVESKANPTITYELPIYYLSLAFIPSSRLDLIMHLDVETIYDSTHKKLLEPMKWRGGDCSSPLVIRLYLTIDLYTGDITNPHRDKCPILFSPHPEINAILQRLDRFTLAEQTDALAPFFRGCLTPSVNPTPGQVTIADLFKTGGHINIPMYEIFPHLTDTNFISDLIELYKFNPRFKTKIDYHLEKDIHRTIRLPNSAEVFHEFETLVSQANLGFLNLEQKILLKMLITQCYWFNPYFAFCPLFIGYFMENYNAIPIHSDNSKGHVLCLSDPSNAQCTLIFRLDYFSLQLPGADNIKEFHYPAIQYWVVIDLCAHPRKIIREAYFTIAPEAQAILKEHHLDNMFNEMLEHFCRHSAETFRELLQIGQLEHVAPTAPIWSSSFIMRADP